MEMQNATPFTPLVYEQNYIFKCKQHTIYDPKGQEIFFYNPWFYYWLQLNAVIFCGDVFNIFCYNYFVFHCWLFVVFFTVDYEVFYLTWIDQLIILVLFIMKQNDIYKAYISLRCIFCIYQAKHSKTITLEDFLKLKKVLRS